MTDKKSAPQVLDRRASQPRVEFVITRIMGHWPLHLMVLLLFSPVHLASAVEATIFGSCKPSECNFKSLAELRVFWLGGLAGF